MPPQHKVAEVIDFRHAALGPRGYKMARKRTIEDLQEQVYSCCFFSLQSLNSPHTPTWLELRIVLNFLWQVFSLRTSKQGHQFLRWGRSTWCLVQAEVEANEMEEGDTVGVPVQASKRQKLNIVGIGKVQHFFS